MWSNDGIPAFVYEKNESKAYTFAPAVGKTNPNDLIKLHKFPQVPENCPKAPAPAPVPAPSAGTKKEEDSVGFEVPVVILLMVVGGYIAYVSCTKKDAKAITTEEEAQLSKPSVL